MGLDLQSNFPTGPEDERHRDEQTQHRDEHTQHNAVPGLTLSALSLCSPGTGLLSLRATTAVSVSRHFINKLSDGALPMSAVVLGGGVGRSI